MWSWLMCGIHLIPASTQYIHHHYCLLTVYNISIFMVASHSVFICLVLNHGTAAIGLIIREGRNHPG